MTRYWFGDSDDWSITRDVITGGLKSTPATRAYFKLEDPAQPETDLLLAGTTPVTEVVSGTGLPVRFKGPDGALALWESSNGGPKVLVMSTDLAEVVSGWAVQTAEDRAAVEALAGTITELATSDGQTANNLENGPLSQAVLTAAIEAVGPINATRFGAIGDGVTDSTSAIQDAIDSVESALSGGSPLGLGGGRIHLPAGEYVISDTLLVKRMGLSITGEGWTNGPGYNSGNPPQKSRGTTIRWKAGSGNKPMLQVRDCYGFTIDNIRFQGGHVTDAANIPTCAINFHSATGDNVGSNGKLFVDRVRIGTYPYTAEVDDHTVRDGILFDGLNANNDEFVISRSYIGYTTRTGIRIEGTQSVWAITRDTLLDHCPTGVYTNSDFSSDNLHFNGCTLDYDIQGGSTAWITRYASERALQFVKGGPGATVHIDNGDLDCGDIVTGTQPNIFDFSGATTAQLLTLRNVDFDSALTTAMKIKMAQAAPSSLGATETIGLTVEHCRGLTPSNLDVALADATDKRDVYWRSNSVYFRHLMRGIPGLTPDTNRFDPHKPLSVTKAVDSPLASTTTFTNDPELAIWLEANSVYQIEVYLQHAGDPAADFAAGISLPAGSTNSYSEWGIASAAASLTTTMRLGSGTATTAGGGAATGDLAVATKVPYLAKGVVRTGSTAGYLRVQWAQAVSNANNTTVFTNSYLTARKTA